MSNYFRSVAIGGILKTIKDNPNILYEDLVIKVGVREPFLKKNTAEDFIKNLIIDKQVSVNEKGELKIC